MATARQVSSTQRANFKRIMAQLDKTTASTKIVKIITQATEFLHEHDVGWDAVSLTIGADYVLLSERRKRKITLSPVAATRAAAALAVAPNGAAPLGYDGRALLKTAITKHADWPTVREALDINISEATTVDLITIGQLLKIDEQFLKLFAEVPAVTQGELPLNGTGGK